MQAKNQFSTSTTKRGNTAHDGLIRLLPAERKAAMEMMTSWRRQGMEEGKHKGKEELLVRLLSRRLSTLPDRITNALDRLTTDY
jgi:hypothetical protein